MPDGGDPLAAPLPNRRLTAQKTFKVSPRLTSNLPPAAPQLAPFPPLMSTALTPPPVPMHQPRITDRQARQSKRLKKAQLAVISAARLNKGSESFRLREVASRDASRVTTPLSGIRDSDGCQAAGTMCAVMRAPSGGLAGEYEGAPAHAHVQNLCICVHGMKCVTPSWLVC